MPLHARGTCWRCKKIKAQVDRCTLKAVAEAHAASHSPPLSLSLSVGRDCPQPSYEDAPKKPTCIHLNYDAVDMALHSRRVRLGNVRQEPCGLAMTLMKSAGLPACLIGGCSCFCSWFVLVSVLGLYLFLELLLRAFCTAGTWLKA